MEGFPGLQLLLMLTGLFASCTSYLFPSPSTASLQNLGKSPKEIVLTQGTSLRIRAFCAYEYLQGNLVWCKEKQPNECRFQNPRNLTELGWQYLTPEANQKIMLEGVVNGCIFLLMKNLQIEDSGSYWFGIQSGMKMGSVKSIKVVVHHDEHGHFLPGIPVSPPTSRMPFTSTVSGMKTRQMIKIQGESLSVKAFCSQQYAQTEKVWCKEELTKECNLAEPISFSGSGWKRLTTQPNQRVILNDLGNGCIYVFMSALQSEDSGIYWFGVLDGPNIIPLGNIRVTVQTEQEREDTGTATSEDERRVYQVVWILVSIAVALTIFAAFALVVIVFIKRKKRVEDDVNYGDNPNCKVISLQIHESNTAQSLHEEQNTIYSIVKMPGSSKDVNRTFPLRSNIDKHSSESIGTVSPSDSVEYASISF
ncbi:uncharacterized protein LOC117664393 [Pantherophis guttatus]|uniref:Uncharacterized protein LOC117664393 n=1 Tax=Pantherophis guttatus TaxID=94885 RepID=A0A6P9BK10_PANGU|nr:uncharacterized protein LOC117664393 [Pantherophis guttatus]